MGVVGVKNHSVKNMNSLFASLCKDARIGA